MAAQPLSLTPLTVPADVLPAGCRLAPRTMAIPPNRVRSLWPMSVATNPWQGTDRKTIATIRERMGVSTPLPDGPPLSAAETRRMLLRTADGIAEGFAAFYYDEQNGSTTAIYGLRTDKVTTAVSGQGPCFEAIKTYVESLP
jgi:hypothetical protein